MPLSAPPRPSPRFWSNQVKISRTSCGENEALLRTANRLKKKKAKPKTTKNQPQRTQNRQMPSAEVPGFGIQRYREAEMCPGSDTVNTITCSPRRIPLTALSSFSSTPLTCYVLSLYQPVFTHKNNAPIILFSPKLPPLIMS